MKNEIEMSDESLPAFPLPAGVQSEADYLRQRVLKWVGLRWRQKPSVEVFLRLHRELDVICRRCPRLFLILDDLKNAAGDSFIPLALNQGAQCGCLTLYALGLICCDPTERGLLFERFMNPASDERGLPVVTAKTDAQGRDWVLAYLERKYGASQVPRILAGFNLVVESVHPIVEECLRETNGLLLYQEQLAEQLHAIGGRPIEWAMETLRSLADEATSCDKCKGEFVEGALANAMFRTGEWKEEKCARDYLDSLWTEWRGKAGSLVLYAHVVCTDRTPRFPTTRKVIGAVSFADIAEALRCGDRVAIVMRHAERPPLPPNDPTFGRDLPLTRRGRREADAFGFALFECCRGYDAWVSAGASTRCQQTAQEISKHAVQGGQAISLDHIMGCGSPFFGDVSDRLKLADAGNSRCALNEYFRTGKQSGYNDLFEATDAFERHIWEDSYGPVQFEIYVTHDVNVACFLAGRGVIPQFDDSTWPKYLDAAVAFLGKYGHARYGVMRSPVARLE